MITASAQWIDRERFAAQASSGHAQVVDADRQVNSGSGPMELVLMGLCCCTATDVVMILRKKRQPARSLRVTAEAERAPEPPTVYTRIHLRYEVEGDVERAAVERAVTLSQEKYCGVSAMLRATAAITWEILLKPATAESSNTAAGVA